MFKKYLFGFIIWLCAITYADSNVGNIIIPDSQNIGRSSTNLLGIKYTIFNYQMKPAEFSKFLKMHNLFQDTILQSTTNIVYLAMLKHKELDSLNQTLTKEFVDKSTGNTTCNINHGICGGSASDNFKIGKERITKNTSILFKTRIKNNKSIATEIISKSAITNELNKSESISFQSTALLTSVKDRNYAAISQISKYGTLYGQIILISFGNGYTNSTK